MKHSDLETDKKPNWCGGCSDYMLLSELKSALREKIDKGSLDQKDVQLATGVGCHGKVFDYMNLGGVYCLHGRVLPTATGIKIGNPSLEVIGIAGDGDTYAEGMSHFVHTARLNTDMTFLVFNNEVFALTTGQSTPTTQKQFESGAQPGGNPHDPVNPLRIAITSGASFVARADAKNVRYTKKMIQKAMEHDGFAYIDVAQQCPIYNPFDKEIENKMSELENLKGAKTKEEALELADRWSNPKDYDELPIGIIWKEQRPTLSDKYPKINDLKETGQGWFDKKNR